MTQAPDEILRRKFTFTDLVSNHNKEWMVVVRADGTYHAEFARIGHAVQIDEKPFPSRDRAIKEAEKKVQEKLKKGYIEVELHTPTATPAAPGADRLRAIISHSPAVHPQVHQFVQWLFQQAGEAITATLQGNVDALSVTQITRGRQILKQVQAAAAGATTNLDSLVQDYYRAIPTKLGHKIVLADVIRELCARIDEEEQRLDALEAALATYTATTQDPQLSQMDALGARIALLDRTTPTYKELSDNILSTMQHGYRIKIKDIYEVENTAGRAAYESCTLGASRTMLLYHGTHTKNLRHIVRTGLRCPRIAANGRMFGDGIYLADQASKSTNYCQANYGTSQMVLLLAEAKVGKRYHAKQAMSHLKAAPTGFDSVWGLDSKNGGTLRWNEFIVYQDTQVDLRYAVTFEK